MSEPFRILVICSGNRCRSPFAAFYLERALEGMPVEVSSAGTRDIGPADVPVEMARVASAVGLELSAHRARALTTVKGAEVDLVIGMERDHVAAAVVDAGMPPEKTFTLAELARLVDPVPAIHVADPASRARTVVAEASARRANAGAFIPDENVPDPFGRSKKVYAQVAERVVGLCDEIVRALFGVDSATIA